MENRVPTLARDKRQKRDGYEDPSKQQWARCQCIL